MLFRGYGNIKPVHVQNGRCAVDETTSFNLDVVKANLTHLTFWIYIVAQTYQAQVYVTLRPSVLDPAGTAVRSGLEHMGYDNVTQVRIGKFIEVSLTADSEDAARSQLDRMCDQLLANPVIENYRIELKTMATA